MSISYRASSFIHARQHPQTASMSSVSLALATIRASIIMIKKGSPSVVISLAGILYAATAAAADDSSGLEEVTVTASKLTATKVLDTPVSIQAISGDALQRSGASGIMDIAGSIPGLSI